MLTNKLNMISGVEYAWSIISIESMNGNRRKRRKQPASELWQE